MIRFRRQSMNEILMWTFAPHVRKTITVADVLGLYLILNGLVVIVPVNQGTNFGIYATDELSERRLKKWLLKNAPLANSRRMRLAAVS